MTDKYILSAAFEMKWIYHPEIGLPAFLNISADIQLIGIG